MLAEPFLVVREALLSDVPIKGFPFLPLSPDPQGLLHVFLKSGRVSLGPWHPLIISPCSCLAELSFLAPYPASHIA